MKSITSTLQHIASRPLHIAQHVLQSTMIITLTFAVERIRMGPPATSFPESMGTRATTEPPKQTYLLRGLAMPNSASGSRPSRVSALVRHQSSSSPPR